MNSISLNGKRLILQCVWMASRCKTTVNLFRIRGRGSESTRCFELLFEYSSGYCDQGQRHGYRVKLDR
jgi:hypothetical protein